MAFAGGWGRNTVEGIGDVGCGLVPPQPRDAPGSRCALGKRQPDIAAFLIALLDCGPGYAMGDFLNSRVILVLLPGVVECLAVDILCVLWQAVAYRRRKVGIDSLGHGSLLTLPVLCPHCPGPQYAQ